MAALLSPQLLFHLLSPTEKVRAGKKGERGGRDRQRGRGIPAMGSCEGSQKEGGRKQVELAGRGRDSSGLRA